MCHVNTIRYVIISMKSDIKTAGLTLKIGFLMRHAYLVLAFLVAASLVRNMIRVISAQKKLDEVRERLVEFERENKELENELEKISSEFYVESQARNKLGLAREGEVILVLPSEEEVKRFSTRRTEDEKYTFPPPNWKKWIEMFIGSS